MLTVRHRNEMIVLDVYNQTTNGFSDDDVSFE